MLTARNTKLCFLFTGLLLATSCTDPADPSASDDMSAGARDMTAGQDQGTPDMPAATEDMAVEQEDMAPASPDADMGAPVDMSDADQGDGEDMAVAPDADMGPPECLPVPGMTREGQPSDGWVWQKQGRLFAQDPPDLAPNEGDYAPTIIEDGNGYRVYFARRRAASFSIYTTTSQDGSTWTDPVAVADLDGDTYPSAIRAMDGTVKMWFGSGSLDYAESADGTTFNNRQDGILRPSEIGGFASLSMIYPEVRPDANGTGYRLWVTGFDGMSYKIGQGTSADGIDWTVGTDLVFEADGEGFDSKSVAQPEVHRVGETWYMWYGGYDTTNSDPGPWRIGLATSPNGVVYERKGVSIPLAEDGDDAWSTRDPAVIKTADGWLMVYVGLAPDGKYRLLSATSTTCPEQ